MEAVRLGGHTVYKGTWNTAESMQWAWRHQEEADVDPGKVLVSRQSCSTELKTIHAGRNGNPHWKCLYQMP